MTRGAALLALVLCVAACGGGDSPSPGGEAGGGGASTGETSGGGGQQPAPSGEYYVDPAGNCAGRRPCYSNLRAAALASLESQFEIVGGRATRARRPNDPADDIVLVGETANLYSTGNLVGNPLFVDAQHSDFRLQSSSPAIDTAAVLSSSEAGKDYNGTVRPQDGDRNGTAVADMGAIEYIP